MLRLNASQSGGVHKIRHPLGEPAWQAMLTDTSMVTEKGDSKLPSEA